MDTLYSAAQHLRPRIPAAAIAPPLTQPDEARAWLAAELPSLVAVAVHAAGHGWPGHATNLSATLYRSLVAGGHLFEAVTIHGHACGAAQQTGDVAAEAGALTSLGIAELQQGRYQRAAGHLERALGLRRQMGDRGGEARALISLGNVAFRQGRYEQAAGHQQLATSLCRQAGNRINEAIAMNNLGITEARLGRFQHAAAHLEQALALSRDTGDRDGEARALQGLGEVSLRQGRHEQAADYLQRALALFRDACHRVGEAYGVLAAGGSGAGGRRGSWSAVVRRPLRNASPLYPVMP